MQGIWRMQSWNPWKHTGAMSFLGIHIWPAFPNISKYEQEPVVFLQHKNNNESKDGKTSFAFYLIINVNASECAHYPIPFTTMFFTGFLTHPLILGIRELCFNLSQETPAILRQPDMLSKTYPHGPGNPGHNLGNKNNTNGPRTWWPAQTAPYLQSSSWANPARVKRWCLKMSHEKSPPWWGCWFSFFGLKNERWKRWQNKKRWCFKLRFIFCSGKLGSSEILGGLSPPISLMTLHPGYLFVCLFVSCDAFWKNTCSFTTTTTTTTRTPRRR